MSSKTIETSEVETVDAASRRVSPQRMTFEEFLASGNEPMMTEWVDGEVIDVSPASRRHQEIFSFLLTLLGLYLEVHQTGTVLPAPFVMKLEKLKRGREPDLLFVSRERAHLIEKTHLNGPADLVVEIVSPESVERDSRVKFAEYEQAMIKEYWLIDPEHQTALFYELGADNRYRAAVTEPDGIYRSRVVPGFFIRTSWLWQTPSPTLDALRELKLI